MSDTIFTAEPGSSEVTITRTFDAPPALVFELYTDPVHIPQWWAPSPMLSTIVDEKTELKAGGMWRYTIQEPSGNSHVFRGTYQAIEAPYKVVYTFEYEIMPGHITTKTATFEDENGRTKYTDRSQFNSAAARDAMINTGMELGSRSSIERLAVLIGSKLQSNS